MKTSIHPRNDTTNRYPLFKEIFGNVGGRSVLDYGGGAGNLLHFSNGEITENQYTCVDVSDTAIDSGNIEFPKAKWVYHNKFNWMYNPNGNADIEFPQVGPTQDLIWSYSVFSHVDAHEFINTILWLTQLRYKKIAISFLDIDGQEMKQYFYNKRVNDYGTCNRGVLELSSSDTNMAYFFDNEKLETNKYRCEHIHAKHFLAFFNKEWLVAELSKHGINAKVITVADSFVPFLLIERE